MADFVPTRAEILRTWPEATWFAGDPAPPAGTAVLLRPDVDGKRRPGEIVGVWTPAETVPAGHCPTCTCQQDNTALSGWFLVRDLSRDVVGEVGKRVTFVPVGTPGAHHHVTIEYPPSLTPVLDQLTSS